MTSDRDTPRRGMNGLETSSPSPSRSSCNTAVRTARMQSAGPWFLFVSLALRGPSPTGLLLSCCSACLLCCPFCDCEVGEKSLELPSLLLITWSRLLSLLTPDFAHVFLCWKSVMWNELVIVSALTFGEFEERLQLWVKGCWLLVPWFWSLPSHFCS